MAKVCTRCEKKLPLRKFKDYTDLDTTWIGNAKVRNKEVTRSTRCVKCIKKRTSMQAGKISLIHLIRGCLAIANKKQTLKDLER